MKGAKRSERGFRTYEPIKSDPPDTPPYGTLELVTSSLARGSFLWFFARGACYEHLGQHQTQSPHLSLRSVKKLIKYLQHWVAEQEAEGGK